MVAVGLGWAAQRYAIAQDPDGFDGLAERHNPPDHAPGAPRTALPHDDYPALAELGLQAVES